MGVGLKLCRLVKIQSGGLTVTNLKHCQYNYLIIIYLDNLRGSYFLYITKHEVKKDYSGTLIFCIKAFGNNSCKVI